MEQSTPVLISLGSNIEPTKHLPLAVERLSCHCRVSAASRVYRSAAAGAVREGTPAFLNAAVRVETEVTPRVFKFEILRPIELALGRQRSADRNAPRTIDLDMVLFGDQVVSVEGIELPDPEIVARAYLAVPLAEVAPGWIHPVDGRSLREIAAGFQSAVSGGADTLEAIDLQLLTARD